MDEAQRERSTVALRHADEYEYDLVAKRLMSHFRRSGQNFSAMTEDDAYEIAAALVEYRDGKEADGTSPPGTVVSLKATCPDFHNAPEL
ncbi:hypothetical protein ACCS88_21035 [Rhizobium ruizarguesonis]